MNTDLTLYIEREIIPKYNGFDKAHREDHARMVIEQSLEIASRLVGQLKGARHYAVNMEMVYAVAAFHDLGLAIDRKTHHLESGRIVREDQACLSGLPRRKSRLWYRRSKTTGHLQTMNREASTARLSPKETGTLSRRR